MTGSLLWATALIPPAIVPATRCHLTAHCGCGWGGVESVEFVKPDQADFPGGCGAAKLP